MASTEEVRAYWNDHIHDLEITSHPVGSRGFFDDLDQYHFEKLHHLLRLVAFDGYRGRSVLEVGCGAGVDLVRFARGGAQVTGVDLAASAIDLARANFAGDYVPKLLPSESIGGDNYHVLELTAVDRTVTYQRVVYWVRQSDSAPLKAEFYSLSNRLLKTCTYEKFQKMAGRARPTRLTSKSLLPGKSSNDDRRISAARGDAT